MMKFLNTSHIRSACVLLSLSVTAAFFTFSTSQALATEGGGQPAREVPTIASVSVSGVTEHDATLEAHINPGGLETSYEFHMTSFACPTQGCQAINDWFLPGGSIPAGSGGQTVSLDLNSAGVTLQPGTRYRYAVTVSNAAGEAPAAGEWERTQQEFKTLSESGTSGPVSETASASTLSQTPSDAGGSQPAASPMVAVLTPTVIPTTLIATTTLTTTESSVTGNGLKLARALKACKKEPKRKQAACERRARSEYATAATRTTNGKRASI